MNIKLEQLQESIVYSNSSENQASLLLSSLLDNYWSDYHCEFAKEIKSINKALSQEVYEHGLNLWVVYENGDTNIDDSEWYCDSKTMENIVKGIMENNEQYDLILDALEDLEETILDDIEKILEEKNISFDDLEELATA